MANQPKKYKKFVATAATAALVASAITPVASAAATPSVTKVSTVKAFSVTNGTSEAAAIKKLPKTVKVTLSNKKTKNVAIKWDSATYNSKKAGTYTFTGTLAKVSGVTNTKFKTIKVKVTVKAAPDKAAPVIVVNTTAITVENGATLTLPTVKVTDNKDKGLKATQVIKNAAGEKVATIDTKVAGVYTVTYTAKDKAGNVAKTKTLKVTVKEADTEKPVITVDTAAITVENGATLTLPTATATDNKDKEVTVSQEIKNAAGEVVTAIDTKVAGVYTVTYTAKDAAGNEAEAKVVTVTVKAGAAAVESVSAVNAKTLKLVVNKELENLTGLTFTVKRGTTAVVLTAKLGEDKKSVELSSDTNLVAGDYTVEVTGGTFATGTNSATVKVEAQKVAKIELLSTEAVLSATTSDTVTLGYVVKDQYGTDITKESLANNITWTSSLGVTPSDDNAGTLTIDKNSEIKKGDTIVVTGVDVASGTTVSSTITAVDSAALATLTFGSTVLPTGKTRIEVGQSSAVDLEVTAVDQYGKAITNASTLTSTTTIVDNDTNASATFVTVNNKAYLRLSTSGMTEAKSVTFTVINNANGKTAVYTFDVVKASEVAEVSATGTTSVVAQGDATGTVLGSLTGKDQFGADLTVDKLVADYTASPSKLTLSSSNSNVITSGSLSIATSGTNKGKIVTTGALTKGTTTITITVPSTGKTASFVLEVKDARTPATIELPSTISTNFVQGATTNTKLTFKDQYGKEFDATGDTANRAVLVSITKVSGDDAGVTVTAAGQSTTGDTITITNESLVDSTDAIAIAAASDKKGSYTVTFKFVDTNNSNEVLSQVTKTVNVVENVSTGLTYAVADIPTLFKGGAAIDGTAASISTTDVAAAYAKEVKVTATDANGNTYVIPSSAILRVDSNNTNILVNQVSGKYYVSYDNTSISADVTGTVSVVINTNDGVKVIDKAVTVSKADRAVSSVVVKDAAPGSTTVNDVTAINVTASQATTDTVNVWVEDQFGGYTLGNAFDSIQVISLTNTGTAIGGTATYTNGVLDLSAVTGKDSGDKFRVVFIDGGKSDYVDVTVGN